MECEICNVRDHAYINLQYIKSIKTFPSREEVDDATRQVPWRNQKKERPFISQPDNDGMIEKSKRATRRQLGIRKTMVDAIE